MSTELQAKESFCPMGRHTMDNEGNFHSPNDPNQTGLIFCMGSRCMMWRWSKENPVKDGYCGLAGKPAVAF